MESMLLDIGLKTKVYTIIVLTMFITLKDKRINNSSGERT